MINIENVVTGELTEGYCPSCELVVEWHRHPHLDASTCSRCGLTVSPEYLGLGKQKQELCVCDIKDLMAYGCKCGGV